MEIKLNKESMVSNLIAIQFLTEVIDTIHKENTIILNDTKLQHWLHEIKEKIEGEMDARN